jgi:hypothetical protein
MLETRHELAVVIHKVEHTTDVHLRQRLKDRMDIGTPTPVTTDHTAVVYLRNFDFYQYAVTFQNETFQLQPILEAVTVLEQKALNEVGKSLPKMVKD